MPEWVRVTPGIALDPEYWGPYVVVKPELGRKGSEIFITRTHRVLYKPPEPEGAWLEFVELPAKQGQAGSDQRAYLLRLDALHSQNMQSGRPPQTIELAGDRLRVFSGKESNDERPHEVQPGLIADAESPVGLHDLATGVQSRNGVAIPVVQHLALRVGHQTDDAG